MILYRPMIAYIDKHKKMPPTKIVGGTINIWFSQKMITTSLFRSNSVLHPWQHGNLFRLL